MLLQSNNPNSSFAAMQALSELQPPRMAGSVHPSRGVHVHWRPERSLHKHEKVIPERAFFLGVLYYDLYGCEYLKLRKSSTLDRSLVVFGRTL